MRISAAARAALVLFAALLPASGALAQGAAPAAPSAAAAPAPSAPAAKPPPARIALVDRIVAVVNKEVVTLSELNERVATAERDIRRQNAPVPGREQLERQVLERLILD